MSRLVDSYPYVMLLFVYGIAFSFSAWHSWYVRTAASEIRTDSPLLVGTLKGLARISELATGIIFVLLVFVVILAVENNLTVEESGTFYLLWIRVAIFWMIGVAFWIIPFTCFLTAEAILRKKAEEFEGTRTPPKEREAYGRRSGDL